MGNGRAKGRVRRAARRCGLAGRASKKKRFPVAVKTPMVPPLRHRLGDFTYKCQRFAPGVGPLEGWGLLFEVPALHAGECGSRTSNSKRPQNAKICQCPYL